MKGDELPGAGINQAGSHGDACAIRRSSIDLGGGRIADVFCFAESQCSGPGAMYARGCFGLAGAVFLAGLGNRALGFGAAGSLFSRSIGAGNSMLTSIGQLALVAFKAGGYQIGVIVRAAPSPRHDMIDLEHHVGRAPPAVAAGETIPAENPKTLTPAHLFLVCAVNIVFRQEPGIEALGKLVELIGQWHEEGVFVAVKFIIGAFGWLDYGGLTPPGPRGELGAFFPFENSHSRHAIGWPNTVFAGVPERNRIGDGASP